MRGVLSLVSFCVLLPYSSFTLTFISPPLTSRGIELVVSLWADLSNLVDATTLALDSSANPIIIAFGAFRITKFSDSLAEATFVLLGMAAERIMPIPAFELVRAYPADCGRLPEAITFIIGQTVDFEVQLPKFTHSNPFGDFKICTISGLHIPRADLIKRLPPVIEPRSIRSPVSHNTPMPGDPEYVPPVPTAPSPCEHSPRLFCHFLIHFVIYYN
ncbi:hypothetical protein LINPERPRIM_LOCUS33973 [Linum perenne]